MGHGASLSLAHPPSAPAWHMEHGFVSGWHMEQRPTARPWLAHGAGGYGWVSGWQMDQGSILWVIFWLALGAGLFLWPVHEAVLYAIAHPLAGTRSRGLRLGSAWHTKEESMI
ncbi:hypothetical protein NDU88_007421 [Pleurodeles waltl]|uniref:Uncharacterized protein n=1 Tax=Pleurodeles waltl TaxID=8319 RepID=A0AAV7MGE2_PLEWA|nr:hypothetical protein NDU88_007421 [Pleurodeles waltl]